MHVSRGFAERCRGNAHDAVVTGVVAVGAADGVIEADVDACGSTTTGAFHLIGGIVGGSRTHHLPSGAPNVTLHKDGSSVTSIFAPQGIFRPLIFDPSGRIHEPCSQENTARGRDKQ